MLAVSPISQRDSRWKDVLLGNGSGSIGTYGCAITAVTTILNFFGITPDVADVNEHLKIVQGFTGTTKNLLDWSAVARAYAVNYEGRWDIYDDVAVKAWIGKGVPVILRVDGAPIGNPGNSHFVVAIGDGKICDPWTGTIRPFSTYPTQTGYRVYTKRQLPPTEETITVATHVFEELVTKATAWDRVKALGFDSADAIANRLSEYEKSQLATEQTLSGLNQLITDRNNRIVLLQEEISSMKQQVLEYSTRQEGLLEQAKLVPQLKEENAHLIQAREIWQKSEITYNKSIAQLRTENEKLRQGGWLVIWTTLLTIIEKWKNMIREQIFHERTP